MIFKMRLEVLDVGCGSMPKGDVNVDLLVQNDEWGRAVNPKAIPNLVKADARYLPFRFNSFELSIASHLIEHNKYPFWIIVEMLRVSKKVRIIVPNEILSFTDFIRPKKRAWVKKHHRWTPTLFKIVDLVRYFNHKIHLRLLEYDIEVWK